MYKIEKQLLFERESHIVMHARAQRIQETFIEHIRHRHKLKGHGNDLCP